MKTNVLCIAFAASVCAGAAWAADAPAAKTGQDAVVAREATMKRMGGAVKAATDPAAKPADAKAKFEEAIQIASSIPSLFPKGTAPGDPGVTKTRALSVIWEKPSEFKAAADNLVTVLKAAEASVDGGDQAKMAAAFGGIGKACKACHETYRGPEKE